MRKTGIFLSGSFLEEVLFNLNKEYSLLPHWGKGSN